MLCAAEFGSANGASSLAGTRGFLASVGILRSDVFRNGDTRAAVALHSTALPQDGGGSPATPDRTLGSSTLLYVPLDACLKPCPY